MIEKIRLSEKNNIGNAENRMAVHTHIIYCHLENKKILSYKYNDRDRIMLSCKYSMSLSLFALTFKGVANKTKYKSDRAGP